MLLNLAGAIANERDDHDVAAPKAERDPGNKKLDGTWRMVGFRPAGSDRFVPYPEGTEHRKMVAGGHFVWTTVKEGRIVRAAGGKVTVRGDRYVEQIEFVQSSSDRWMIGNTAECRWTLDGKMWQVEGVIRAGEGVSELAEIWERVD
jgi:hypothetical protein